jgi:hypothetical protein
MHGRTYDKTIEALRAAVTRAGIARSERVAALKRRPVMRLATRISYLIVVSRMTGEARTARLRGSGAGRWGPVSNRAGVWGGAPR